MHDSDFFTLFDMEKIEFDMAYKWVSQTYFTGTYNF